MTEQSIGGRNAQDGIRGTPSGTQGADSGQGINQGGQSQQSAQGQPDVQHGIGPQDTQFSPQESNRDRYGDQETGATSGEVGDGRSEQQVARSGSQATQHSKGRDDGALPAGNKQWASLIGQQTTGTGTGYPDSSGNSNGGQATPEQLPDSELAKRQQGMRGTQGEPGHDIDDIGSKQSDTGGSRSGSRDDQR